MIALSDAEFLTLIAALFSKCVFVPFAQLACGNLSLGARAWTDQRGSLPDFDYLVQFTRVLEGFQTIHRQLEIDRLLMPPILPAINKKSWASQR